MNYDWITGLAIGVALTTADLSAQAPRLDAPVRLTADGGLIDTGKDVGHAGPLLVDWDQDGLPDLLVSSFRGSIRFFKNVGTRSEPVFAEKEPLAAGGVPIRIHNW